MKSLITVFILLISLSSCNRAPTAEEWAKTDYGSYPKNYEKIIKDYFAGILKDPGSPTFAFTKPPTQSYDGYLNKENRFGYVVCGTVNAKNSYGGYTGPEPFYIFLRNDRIIYHDSISNYLLGRAGSPETGHIIINQKCFGS